jgi:RNA polymerase sigma factor (sigma-70 family)
MIIARQVRRRYPWVDEGDLFGEGAVALMRVAERFNASRGVKLWSYAERRVKGAMFDYIRTEAARDSRMAPWPTTDEGEPMEFPDDSLPAPGVAVDAERRRRLAWSLIGGLPEREARVIVMADIEGMTRDAIGAAEGVSGSRVSQIHRQAMESLRRIARRQVA